MAPLWLAATPPVLLSLALVGSARRTRRLRARVAAAERLIGLGVRDLQEAALFAIGQAGHAGTGADGFATLALRCRGLAEDLAAALQPRPFVLRREPVDLHACAREAVAALAASLAPGSRRVRITCALAEPILPLDRRAVREVLRRVLTEAALRTTGRAAITLSIAAGDDGGVTLAVADEGSGCLAPDAADALSPDSRGISASLSLARALMRAHGGDLAIEGALGTGSRVILSFGALSAPLRPCHNNDALVDLTKG